MNFNYKALDKNGTVVEGQSEAADRFALARELRAKGLETVVSVSPVALNTKRYLPSFVQGMLTHVSMRDKILFATNTSAMIKAGLPLTRAIGVMERQANGKNFKAILKGLGERVEHGESLSQAVRGYPNVFPPIFGAMIAAGEESGNLPDSLNIVGNQLNKTYELYRKIRGAMLYPAIVMSAITGVGVLLMIYLVPILSATFEELKVELPLPTRMLIGTSNFMANHTVITLSSLCALVLGFWWYAKTTSGKSFLQKIFLKLPIIGQLIKKTNAAVTMRTLSSLISAGVGLVDALIVTEGVLQNFHYRKVMVDATKRIGAGDSLSDTFNKHSDLYPVLVGEMVAVGEETGSLSDMLLKGAIFYEDEVEQTTKNLSTIIEPVLMVVVGIAVGFFAIAMISPIYSLVDVI